MPETPLAARHAARGAILADDRGILLPRRFGDAEAEYRALREGAALVDLSFRVPVRVTGADRATFLQGMLTNDVASLRPGAGCAALLLTIQGRVTADVRVLALEDVL
ncbi:MAG TPA: aminomethyl transferase family protein, partial [Candidatus Binatia bacterium]|nr:aminomethyl transferase family protein [Candidatus Binatia bacterium]